MSTQEPSKCCVCGEPTTKRCQACARGGFDLFFCSPEHQKLVWPDHKLLCGARSARAAPLGGLDQPEKLAAFKAAFLQEFQGRKKDLAGTGITFERMWSTFLASGSTDVLERIVALLWQSDVAKGSVFDEAPDAFAAAILLGLQKYARTPTDWESLQPLRNAVYHHAYVFFSLARLAASHTLSPAFRPTHLATALEQFGLRILPFLSFSHPEDMHRALDVLQDKFMVVCTRELVVECRYNFTEQKVEKFACSLRS